ncbi:MBL fold metallo-hydrolase [Bacillus thuringiensis]|nr:MBL fold metallo-hydrolase [Bacillus thuringiensis]
MELKQITNQLIIKKERSIMTKLRPVVAEGKTIQVAERVWVIPDQRVPLVPNIGIIVGDESVLVIDTGMGPKNAQVVMKEVRKITDKKRMFFTTTHFHPEHNFGAQFFANESVIIYNQEQKLELLNKGPEYIELFKGFGEDIAEFLEDVQLVMPSLTYKESAEIDLGGITVQLFSRPAHTRGDQVIFLPEQRVLFCGDLVENRFFSIFPDEDAKGSAWIDVLENLQKFHADIVVPGHGEIGNNSLISECQGYLLKLKERTQELLNRNVNLAEAQQIIETEMISAYPEWEETQWIRAGVESFYRELSI